MITMEQLRAEPAWKALTPKQQKFVEAFLADPKHNPVEAVKKVYDTRNPSIMAGQILRKARVIHAIILVAPESLKEDFLNKVIAMMGRHKLTAEHIKLMRLYAEIQGFKGIAPQRNEAKKVPAENFLGDFD